MVESGRKPTPTTYAVLGSGIGLTGVQEEAVEWANFLFGMGVITDKLLQKLLNKKKWLALIGADNFISVSPFDTNSLSGH